MNPDFNQRIARFPAYLAAVNHQPPCTRLTLEKHLPAEGIYVFYERGRPQYVGRSGRLRQRLLEHGGESSSHYSASFAFLLAREKALEQAIDATRARGTLQQCPLFGPLFLAAKKRVALMEIRYVAITDEVEQALFEIYAALALKTPDNHFGTY